MEAGLGELIVCIGDVFIHPATCFSDQQRLMRKKLSFVVDFLSESVVVLFFHLDMLQNQSFPTSSEPTNSCCCSTCGVQLTTTEIAVRKVGQSNYHPTMQNNLFH
ncbi:hypothetical protein T09_3417, partial [Trichinella sp. T9]